MTERQKIRHGFGRAFSLAQNHPCPRIGAGSRSAGEPITARRHQASRVSSPGHGATGGCRRPMSPRITAHTSHPTQKVESSAKNHDRYWRTHLCARGATAYTRCPPSSCPPGKQVQRRRQHPHPRGHADGMQGKTTERNHQARRFARNRGIDERSTDSPSQSATPKPAARWF